MGKLRANLDKPGASIDWNEVAEIDPAKLRALEPRGRKKTVWRQIATGPEAPRPERPRVRHDREEATIRLDPDARELLNMIQAHLKKERLLIRTEREPDGDDPHLGVILGEALRFWWKHAKKEATEK